METMGTNERPTVGPLIGRLVRQPQEFDLFQAISLLERAAPNLARVGKGEGQPESVLLRSVVSLGFQPSDISKVSAPVEEGQGHTLTTGVMSLAGANSPLPLPFTELVLERIAVRDYATAEFLDIFNHRFLVFLYRSRKKHHMGLNWDSPQSSSIAACLDSLSALGLNRGEHETSRPIAWLRHAGLLGGAPRSMVGLLAMLSDRLGLHVSGRQFCGGWRNLETRDITKLSSRGLHRSPRLGRTAVLGKRVWDQSAGIALEFKKLSLPRLKTLLRGEEGYELLKWMVRRYLQQDLDVEVILALKPDDQPLMVLGQKESLRLGWTSWLVTRTDGSKPLPPARFKLYDASQPSVF